MTKSQAARPTVRVKTTDRNLFDRAAQDALLDQTLFKVSPKVYRQFVARLDTPPIPNKKLRRMMIGGRQSNTRNYQLTVDM
jgi:uncharacterized protein (DUF1778 family)